MLRNESRMIHRGQYSLLSWNGEAYNGHKLDTGRLDLMAYLIVSYYSQRSENINNL